MIGMASMDPDTLTAEVFERMRKRIDNQAYNYLTGYEVMWSDNTSDNTDGLEYPRLVGDAQQRRIAEEYRRAVEAEMRRRLERDQEPWTVPVKIKKPKVAKPKPEPEPEPKPFGHRDLILD